MGSCVIIGAGDVSEKLFEALSAEMDVIAVDGGYEYAANKHIVPILTVGDFDSLGYVPVSDNVEQHPVMKDKTDMILAVDEAYARGYDMVYVLGAMGGKRADHTVANYQLLSYVGKYDMNIVLLDDNTCAFMIKNKSAFFSKMGITIDKKLVLSGRYVDMMSYYKGYLSVFAVGEAKKVTITGCKYNVWEAALDNSFPIGVSNELKENTDACVSVGMGEILIMLCV